MRLHHAIWLAAALLTGCKGDITPSDVDLDGDGFTADVDCADQDGAVNPDAAETCNGIDDNCDGTVDEAGTEGELTFYADADGDGHGDANATVTACFAPDGYVAAGDDCDDTDPAFHPGAHEDSCFDQADYNCDGSVGYDDADGDGVAACMGDCDDADPDVSPVAVEVCNDKDDNCDGNVDELAVDASTYYADEDGDGYGGSVAVLACTAPAGFTDVYADCDDTNPATYPGGTEVCDGSDNDCNGTVDDGATDPATWYADSDGDGFGNKSKSVSQCAQPSGYVADASDCDDKSGKVNPKATEACDSVDNDCDGAVDEAGATGETTWYVDADGDGFGGSTSTTSCSQPSGYVSTSTDCNDLDDTSFPGGVEVCDGQDNDCNGPVDDSPADPTTWYADTDGDGAGDPATSTSSCTVPSGYVDNDLDCAPSDASKIDCSSSSGASYTFTTCSQTGYSGPSQSQCDSAYKGTSLSGLVTVSSGIQTFTVQKDGAYRISAYGAQGASGDTPTYAGGKGAVISGDFLLYKGDVLQIAVGQQGATDYANGGGGGGSFVVDESTGAPIVIAGGGGGTRASVSQNGCDGQAGNYATGASGSSMTTSCAAKSTDLGYGGQVSSSSWGSAGAGFYGNGNYEYSAAYGGYDWANGLYGGHGTYCSGSPDGGFGGGGSGNGCFGGGGGGGYSGGDGGRVAGGAGSYNAGDNQTNTGGGNNGDGKVLIVQF